jgi:hypothetical protein
MDFSMKRVVPLFLGLLLSALIGLPVLGQRVPSNARILSQLPLVYVRSAAEITAGVYPTNYYYLPGDVRRYGGICNGSTSGTADTVALGAATSIDGPLVIQFYGLCVANSPLNVLSNVTLSGNGVNTGIIYKGAANTTAVTFASGVTHAGIQNMALTGPGLLARHSVNGVNFAAGSSWDFAKDVTVTGFPGIGSFGTPGIGIIMLGTNETVDGCDVENNEYGVQIAGSLNRLLNSYISNHFSVNGTFPWTSAQPIYDGVEVGGSDQLISGNTVTDNGQSGIYIGGNGYVTQRVSVTGNKISYNWNNGLDQGLQIDRSRANDVIGITATGNVSYNNRENNYWMAGIAYSTLTGNTGIYDANYATWPGFKAHPGTHMNIGLYDGASGAQLIGDTITGNTTTDNQGNVGISLSYATTPPTGVTISGNAVSTGYFIYNGGAYIANFIDAAHVETIRVTAVGWTGQTIASQTSSVRFAGKRADYSLVLTLGTASRSSGDFVISLPYITSMALQYANFTAENWDGWSRTLGSDLLAPFVSVPRSGQIEVARIHSGSSNSDALTYTATGSKITINGTTEF